MNLLSDLSSELAVAILLDKKHSGKTGTNDAVSLIGKVFDILEPISTASEDKQKFAKAEKTETVSH